MSLPTHTMPIGIVAAALGLSTQRVRDLDEQLQPVHAPNGYRYYDPAVVARVARSRAARKAAR